MVNNREDVVEKRTSRFSLREDRLHGNDRFPLAAYLIERSAYETPTLDVHWHAENEFFMVMEGEVLFQVDTDTFLVKAGEAVAIDGGEIHAGYPVADKPCTYIALVFDPVLLESSRQDASQEAIHHIFVQKKSAFPRHIKSETTLGKQLLSQLQLIFSLFEEGKTGYESLIKGHLFLMVGHLLQTSGQENRSTGELPADYGKIARLKQVITYMHQHYTRPIRLSELAEQIPLSEGQFSRFFKEMTRQSPIEYLNAYRIKQAAALLTSSDRSISAIALDVGFDHMSYFVKVFRKQMKCTPSAYRKEQRPALC